MCACKSAQRPERPPGCRPGRASCVGRRSASSQFSVRRWLSGSKKPMASSSSPKNSARTGWSCAGEKTSRMPPRSATADALDEAGAGIAGGGELFRQLVEVITAARRQADGGGVERRFRIVPELERLKRRNKDGNPARREVVEDTQPPLLPFAGDARRIDRNVSSRDRKRHRRLAERPSARRRGGRRPSRPGRRRRRGGPCPRGARRSSVHGRSG